MMTHLHDIATIVQIFAGVLILFFSILQGLKIKKDISEDLQGKWFAVIFFMVFFLLCYILFVFLLLFNKPVPLVMATGTVFLAGSCFVFLVTRITRTTMEHQKQAGQGAEAGRCSDV